MNKDTEISLPSFIDQLNALCQHFGVVLTSDEGSVEIFAARRFNEGFLGYAAPEDFNRMVGPADSKTDAWDAHAREVYAAKETAERELNKRTLEVDASFNRGELTKDEWRAARNGLW
jgi:hypothetical protein